MGAAMVKCAAKLHQTQSRCGAIKADPAAPNLSGTDVVSTPFDPLR